MQKKQFGFTLIEMLLVIVIVASVLYMGLTYMQQKTQSMRIDRASIQMQQILNAGMSYYVTNGSWPVSLACLQGNTSAGSSCTIPYLPSTMTSPWGTTYVLKNTASNLYVYSTLGSTTLGSIVSAANIIAGRIPLGYTTTDVSATPPAVNTCTVQSSGSASCSVVGSVNIPGQNLNNATAVNYAGLYHNGGCVPVPTCPTDASGNQMVPQIMVVPVSLKGVNDSGNSSNVYAISSFTAYATNRSTTPDNCYGGGSSACAAGTGGSIDSSRQYWRVCVSLTTQKGNVSWNSGSDNSGQYQTVMAITRCAINNEAIGSGFSVYTQTPN